MGTGVPAAQRLLRWKENQNQVFGCGARPGRKAYPNRTRALLFTLARVLHISLVTAYRVNPTKKEKLHGSQKIQQEFEKRKEASTYQDLDPKTRLTFSVPILGRRRLR
jgi:hypothetical protein